MIHHPHQFQKGEYPELAIALGFFDGVHMGHQKVISTATSIAKENNWKSAVMTFDPHPSVVLGKGKKPVQYITPLEDKIKFINTLGVDYLFVIRFTSAFSSLEPEEFVDQYLINLNVKHVIAGFDYSYGKFGKGNMELLPKHSKGNFDVTTISKLEKNNEKISSTAIRQLINNGDMQGARKLLGRYYITEGTVVNGDKRGRTIGFPTANVALEGDYLTPKGGIYSVKFFVSGKWENGVCNVGYNPTFTDRKQLSIEVFILDYNQYIYGEKVAIEWHERIRDELKFENVDDLIAEMNKDVETARDYFKKLDKET
nr:bifunctional riboflavin kinase/FAD synthetase [Paenibacillus bovis]